jgi:GntR family transcriptional regulator
MSSTARLRLPSCQLHGERGSRNRYNIFALTDHLLDSRLSDPLWSQLTGILRERLLGGGYNERFPTEMELTQEFEVSRATVREAIRRLRDEGLLEARRGSGTFVLRRELEQGLIGMPGLAHMITAAGHKEESAVLRLSEAPAGLQAAQALRIGPEEEVVWVERVRSADGQPVALDRSALSLSRDERTAYLSAELTRGSIYQALEERCGIQVTGASEQVRAAAPTEEEEKLLGLETGEGLLEIELVSFVGGIPIEWRVSRVRGSAYVLSAQWGRVPSQGAELITGNLGY